MSSKQRQLEKILKENGNCTIRDLEIKVNINEKHLKELLISLLYKQMTTSTSDNKFKVDHKMCRKIINLLEKIECGKDHRLDKIKSLKLYFEMETGKYSLPKRDSIFELLLDVIKDMTPHKFIRLKDVISSVIKDDISNYYLIQSIINIYVYYQYYNNSAVTDIFYLEKLIKELSINYKGDSNKITSYLSFQKDKFKRHYDSETEYKQISKYIEKLTNLLNRDVKLSKKLSINVDDDHFYLPDYSVLSKLENNEINDVLDLRKIPTITLDPDGTGCFDDAFSVISKPNGNYLINVYISNVSDSIQFGTDVEKAAYFQGETIYRVSDRRAMLPDEMSYDQFSLKESKDRSVVAYSYELNSKFELIHFKIKRAVINVDRNFFFSDTEINDQLNLSDNNYRMLNLSYYVLEMFLNKAENFQQRKNVLIFEKFAKYDGVNKYGAINPMLKNLIEYSTYRYFTKNELPYVYRVQTNSPNKLSIHKLLRDWKKRKDLNKVFDYIEKTSLPVHYLSTIDMEFDDVNYSIASNTSPVRRYSSFVAQKLIIAFMIDQKKFDQIYLEKLKYQLDMITNYLNVNRNIGAKEVDEFVKVKTIN